VNDKLDWIDRELAEVANSGLLRKLSVCAQGVKSTELRIAEKTYVNFSSNDYLGLAAELGRVREISPDMGQKWGSGASPLVTGRGEMHQQLEHTLAEFKGTEAALSFPTGYSANIGAITSVTGDEDIIFSDARNHASIIDGCRLSKATVQVYRHNDVDHLVELCKQSSGFRRKLIVTDSLFSMDGDIAPLESLVEVSRQYEAMLLVDEAHATGVYGETGRGLTQELGCEDGVDISVGTMSKALGSVGGFVTGNQNLIDLLVNKSRTYIYSTAMPHACARAGIRALELMRKEPERREQLFRNVKYLTDRLVQNGALPDRPYTQIVPLIVGSPESALDRSKSLMNAGFYIPAIRPPTVPVGASLLRISLSSAHTTEQLDSLVSVLSE